MNTTTTRPSERIAARIAVLHEAMTDLAAWADEHPEVELSIHQWTGSDTIYAFARTPEDFAAWSKALKDGAPVGAVRKSSSDRYVNTERDFGPFIVQVSGHHEDVCERVVVGTETVLAPDPAAVEALPKVEQTVEKVEWRCPPILARDETAVA